MAPTGAIRCHLVPCVVDIDNAGAVGLPLLPASALGTVAIGPQVRKSTPNLRPTMRRKVPAKGPIASIQSVREVRTPRQGGSPLPRREAAENELRDTGRGNSVTR